MLDPRNIMILKLLKAGRSIRQIGKEVGYRSPATVHEKISELISQGYLTRIAGPKISNGWKLTEKGERMVSFYEPRSHS
jgi:molybdate transport repressor ModE-like protein